MFSRDEMQRAIEDALKSMEGVALELYRRGREPLLEELEEARARNADMRAMLEQVTRERDEARAACPDCAMWAERSARWHDGMQRAERERDEARADLARSVAAWESAGMQGRTAHDAMLALAKERDEARAKYEVLHEEADRALRAPLLALSAIVGGDAFFAPGPWDSQTQGMNALAERITRSFAIWRDRASKQSTEDFKRGAEAMREACQQWFREHDESFELTVDACHDVIADMPIPEES